MDSREGLYRWELKRRSENTPEMKGCIFPWTVIFPLDALLGELHLGVSSAVSQGSPTVQGSPGYEAHPNSLNPANCTEGTAVRF